jgi:hypothetical protein
MKIVRALNFLAVVFAVMTLTAFAAPKSIKVATDATWPPMEMVGSPVNPYDVKLISSTHSNLIAAPPPTHGRRGFSLALITREERA